MVTASHHASWPRWPPLWPLDNDEVDDLAVHNHLIRRYGLLRDGPTLETTERVSLSSRDVAVLQSYDSAPGMSIAGEAIFASALAERQKPKSLKSIILCRRNDRPIREALRGFSHIEIVIDDAA